MLYNVYFSHEQKNTLFFLILVRKYERCCYIFLRYRLYICIFYQNFFNALLNFHIGLFNTFLIFLLRYESEKLFIPSKILHIFYQKNLTSKRSKKYSEQKS